MEGLVKWSFVVEVLPILVEGAIITVEATLIGFVLAAIIGLILAILRRSRSGMYRGQRLPSSSASAVRPC